MLVDLPLDIHKIVVTPQSLFSSNGSAHFTEFNFNKWSSSLSFRLSVKLMLLLFRLFKRIILLSFSSGNSRLLSLLHMFSSNFSGFSGSSMRLSILISPSSSWIPHSFSSVDISELTALWLLFESGRSKKLLNYCCSFLDPVSHFVLFIYCIFVVPVWS